MFSRTFANGHLRLSAGFLGSSGVSVTTPDEVMI